MAPISSLRRRSPLHPRQSVGPRSAAEVVHARRLRARQRACIGLVRQGGEQEKTCACFAQARTRQNLWREDSEICFLRAVITRSSIVLDEFILGGRVVAPHGIRPRKLHGAWAARSRMMQTCAWSVWAVLAPASSRHTRALWLSSRAPRVSPGIRTGDWSGAPQCRLQDSRSFI